MEKLIVNIRGNTSLIISLLHGGIIFLLFIYLNNLVSRIVVETDFSMKILRMISGIDGAVNKRIAGIIYTLSYDMFILLVIATIVTLLMVKFGSNIQATLLYSLGMVAGTLVVDLSWFVVTNFYSIPALYLQTYMLFSAKLYQSIGIVILSTALCYWVSLKLGLRITSRRG